MLTTAVQQVNKSVPASLRFDGSHGADGLFKRLKSPAPLQQNHRRFGCGADIPVCRFRGLSSPRIPRQTVSFGPRSWKTSQPAGSKARPTIRATHFPSGVFFRRHAARNLQHSDPRLTPWATLCRCSAAILGRTAIGRSGGNSGHSFHNNRVASARTRFV